MRPSYFGFKDRFIVFCICVCGVLAFSTTLSASVTLFPGTFTLGNAISTPYYQVTLPGGGNDGSAVPAGPYPGALTGSPMTLFFCVSGNLESNWDTSYDGTESAPSTVLQDEAAFLASLFLSDAATDGITLDTSVGSNGYETLNETGPNLSDFINNVQGPISMAIWQIMGSLPSGSPYDVTQDDPKAASLVLLAQANYSTSSSGVLVFVPGASGIQSFIGVSEAVPEPETLFLFGTGLLLIALGCTRRLARRPR